MNSAHPSSRQQYRPSRTSNHERQAGVISPATSVIAARAFFGVTLHHRLLHDIFGLPIDLFHEATVGEYVVLFLDGLVQQSSDS